MKSEELRSVVQKFLAAVVVVLVSTIPVWAAHEKILHNFINLAHGANPEANLIADAAGNLYGTTSGGGAHGLGTVFKLSPGSGEKWTESVIYSFLGVPDGASPAGGLVFDSGGNLYGTTTNGGFLDFLRCGGGCGVLFKLTPVSGGKWVETVLHTFGEHESTDPDGILPYAALVFDSAGNLYGTTGYGGAGGWGTAFRLTPTPAGGWTESILYAFTESTDGALPGVALVFDKAGNLYGTTALGGDPNCVGNYGRSGCGTVFELAPQANGAWKEITLYSFQGSQTFSELSTNLAIDSNGDLYGTTSTGQSPDGSVFRLRSDAKGNWIYKTLYAFAGGSDGAFPSAGLILGAAGRLYGTTADGGVIGNTTCLNQNGCGTIFELAPHSGDTWSERVIHRFSGGRDGSTPSAALTSDQTGNLYTTAYNGGGGGCDYLSAGCGAVLKLSRSMQGKWTADPIYDFAASDGFDPLGPLIADSSGNLYGSTNAGGKGPGHLYGVGGQQCPYGCGTVFKLSRSSGGQWSRSLLYSFTGTNGDGAFPWGNLTFDDAGNLYGTTQWGGANGQGTVFELVPTSDGKWKATVIYSFAHGNSGDGAEPVAGLIFDAAGNLYGTTLVGGVGEYGTVFKLSFSGGAWRETVLYGFAGGDGDGIFPTASLVFDNAGNLYGTTSGGGSPSCQLGCGTVFKLSPSGNAWKETVLYYFDGPDGAYPQGNLILDDEGDLYGTTNEGGKISKYCQLPVSGCGTVFKLTHHAGSAWTKTILYSFASYAGDAAFPGAGLTFDVAGNLYGTSAGGTKSLGTVYKLTPSSGGKWTESILHDFAGYPSDGGVPATNVSFDAEGNLYGTTSVGGTGGGASFGGFRSFGGTVFEITP